MLCKSPNYLKSAGGLVPCGQCLPCRINRVRKWTFRLLLEFMSAESSCWLTITYNDHFLPHDYFHKDDGKFYSGYLGRGTLAPDHMRLFIMKLRRKLGRQGIKKIRYFYCGEYGERLGRPHYHMCLFGVGPEWIDTIRSCWSDPKSKMFMGGIQVGTLTPDSLRYTCGYVVKKLTKKDDEKLNGSFPEFSRYSTAIGVVSIDKIASSFSCKSLDLYYQTHGDIPRTFNVMGKNYPIDRYTRHRILKALGIDKEALDRGQKTYKEEMQTMLNRSELAPEFRYVGASPAFMLETFYKKQNAQSILNAETKTLIYLQSKEKKL